MTSFHHDRQALEEVVGRGGADRGSGWGYWRGGRTNTGGEKEWEHRHGNDATGVMGM